MELIYGLITVGVGATVTGMIVNRILNLPDAKAREEFRLGWRGLLVEWLCIIVGFGLAQMVYGRLTGGRQFPDGSASTGYSWLIVTAASCSGITVAWALRRFAARKDAGEAEPPPDY